MERKGTANTYLIPDTTIISATKRPSLLPATHAVHTRQPIRGSVFNTCLWYTWQGEAVFVFLSEF
jgi:hypothetical protein